MRKRFHGQLFACFRERFAEQAVSVARRVDFALTGELPESAVRDTPVAT